MGTLRREQECVKRVASPQGADNLCGSKQV